MSDTSDEGATHATPFWKQPRSATLMVTAGILSLGMVAGGYLMGDGLLRAKMADRYVTVRGLAERDVMADLATWTIAYSATATNMAEAQASVDRDTAALTAWFAELGFPAEALEPVAVNVSSYTQDGVPQFTVRQRMSLRSNDIERAQDAVRRQFELVRRGVLLEEGSGMTFTFTDLNSIKPEMVAEATRDARASAEQFAEDSGAEVGSIRQATQGYFSIESRDGDGGGWGVADTPFKKVRVVTTVEFMLD